MHGYTLNAISRKCLVALLPVLMLAATVHGVSAEATVTPIPMISGIEMLKVGDDVPDFTISDISGNEVSMSRVLQENKGVLIFFWSIFCEPCKAELPIIQDLLNNYKSQKVEFIGVALDGSPMKEAIAGFVKQEKYSFQVLIDELNPDESFKVSDPYGVAGTPTLYVIGSEGKVHFAKVGRASEEELEKAIKQILN